LRREALLEGGMVDQVGLAYTLQEDCYCVEVDLLIVLGSLQDFYHMIEPSMIPKRVYQLDIESGSAFSETRDCVHCLRRNL